MSWWQVLLVALFALWALTTTITLSLYFIWHYERLNHLPAEARGDPGLLASIAAIATETLAIFVVGVTMPLRLIHDLSPIKRKGDDTPVLLVHGYGGSSANLLLVQLRLQLAGFKNVYAFNASPPIYGMGKLGQELTDFARKVLETTGKEKLHFVGHSMGGILVRWAVTSGGLEGSTHKVVTLGSPHRGSRVANMMYPIGAAADMRFGSAFFERLNAQGLTPGADKGIEYCAIYSSFDNFIIPYTSADLGEHATNIHVAYHGHCMLAYSPVVFGHIRDFLMEKELEAKRAA